MNNASLFYIRDIALRCINFLKTSKGYLNAGFPKFNDLFGRDSLISARQLLETDPLIAKNTLEVLAEFQGKEIDLRIEEEPGKFFMNIEKKIMII